MSAEEWEALRSSWSLLVAENSVAHVFGYTHVRWITLSHSQIITSEVSNSGRMRYTTLAHRIGCHQVGREGEQIPVAAWPLNGHQTSLPTWRRKTRRGRSAKNLVKCAAPEAHYNPAGDMSLWRTTTTPPRDQRATRWIPQELRHQGPDAELLGGTVEGFGKPIYLL